MKKLLSGIVLLTFILAGCGSKEKMKTHAEKEIMDLYGVEVRTVQIERSSLTHQPLFYVLSSIFGDFYELTFETIEEPSLRFTGSIHSNDYNQFHDNFVIEKHKWLLENNPDYKHTYTLFEKNGLNEMTLSNGFTKNKNVNILFSGKYNGQKTNIEELTEAMNTIAGMVVQDKPFETSISFQTEEKRWIFNSMKDVPIEASIYSYDLPVTTTFQSKLEEQLVTIQANHSVDEPLIQQLKDLQFEISSDLRWDVGNGIDQKWYSHQIKLYVLNEYSEERLLQALALLRNAGMKESYVKLSSQQGPTQECQLKELNNQQDIARCFY